MKFRPGYSKMKAVAPVELSRRFPQKIFCEGIDKVEYNPIVFNRTEDRRVNLPYFILSGYRALAFPNAVKRRFFAFNGNGHE